jgi:CheY-like chemotaxis protein
MIRRVVVTMLTRLGFKVLQAEDGVEALEVFAQHRMTSAAWCAI